MAGERQPERAPREFLTVGDIAYLAGAPRRLVERLIELDLVQPLRPGSPPCFSADAVSRVIRIRRIHVELGVSWTSMPLVLDLLDRIRDLEDRLRAP
jgi:hypothetical protein